MLVTVFVLPENIEEKVFKKREVIPFSSVEERLQYLVPKIRVSDVNFYEGTPCWEWTRSLGARGYGQFNCDHQRFYSHIEMYKLYKGIIPDGLQIDHLCRNTACCNPAHLEAVTQAVNIRRGVAGLNRIEEVKLQTHCIHGHEFTVENTRYVLRKNGNYSRRCRACGNTLSKEYAKRKAAKKLEEKPIDWKRKPKLKQTHCKRGHENIPENRRGRQCELCRKEKRIGK